MRFIHHFLLIFPVLSGCGCRDEAVRPVEVQVPVAVSCVPGGVEAPDWNIARLAPDASAADRLKAALADLELSRGYIAELEAELAACG